MSSANNQDSMEYIADVLASFRRKGVRLWSENGQLRYNAPKGVLTREDIERVRLSKRQIVALLEMARCAEIAELRSQPRGRRDRAPLAFSQLVHWHLYQLSERRSTRQIASATRFRGRLNIDALQRSIAEIVHRHDALRTRVVILDGVPGQQISESGDCDLRPEDLTKTSQSLRETETRRIIEQFLLEPIDVTADKLFDVRLLKLHDDEHVLIVALEHIIADLFSLNILMRDLLVAYTQASRGQAFSLPAVPIQFADYAVWQRNTQTSWIEQHGAYWNERLAGCRRLRFPEGKRSQTATRLGWGTVPLQIGSNVKTELREWCRLKRTTLALGVFTAYAGLVLRWCEASEAVMEYVTDGRTSAPIENTIGFFASVLHLRIGIFDDDSFVDLMNRVTQEYCNAYQHADYSYIAAQVPRPEFTRNTVFNWVPQGSKLHLSSMDGSEGAIHGSPIRFTHPMIRNLDLDSEPSVQLFDADDEIVGDLHFPIDRFSVDTMERFRHNFLLFIGALLEQPERRVKEISLL